MQKEAADKLARGQYDTFHAERLTRGDERAEREHQDELRSLEERIAEAGDESD